MIRYSSIVRDVIITIVIIVLAFTPPNERQKIMDIITCFEQTREKGVTNVSDNQSYISSNHILSREEDGS